MSLRACILVPILIFSSACVYIPQGLEYAGPKERPKELVKRDLARGYISDKTAAQDYGLSGEDIAAVHAAVAAGKE